jgi:hypothetical protein
VYRNIEFARNPETLWGKLREGRWDWLGVHPDGQFVLGSPRRSEGTSLHASGSVIKSGATEGVHGVRIFTDPGRENSPSQDWFGSRDEAKADYDRRVTEFEQQEGPLLVKVELVWDGRVADRAFVVNAPPTYGVWRAPQGL